MPGIEGALIGAGASLLGSGIDAIAQIGQNKKAREHQEYMYDKNNAYNTPAMQMQRFKAAGLNPHLIYGQGNSGNSTVPPLTTQEAPKSHFAEITQNYVANRTQQAQVDNMAKALQVMEADKTLKEAQTVNTLTQSAQTEQQREQSAVLFDTVQSQAKANLGVTTQNLETGLIQQQKLKAEIDNVLQNTSISKTNQSSILQTIVESKARVRNLAKDGRLKDAETELKRLELNLRKLGVNPNDPAWMRIVTQNVADPSLWEKLKQGVKKLWQHQPELGR